MIVRTLEDIKSTKGEVKARGWSSWRLLHREDGMGVTLTDASLEVGVHDVWWYRNHLECVYCLEGEGTLTDLSTNKTYTIEPGTIYALDNHEPHRLEVTSRMRVICTFVPPLVGGEIHDANGVYPLQD
jgi:L-ectoine synthase